MEQKILAVIAQIDAAGGMYKAAEAGLVQTMIGDSALAYQEKIENGSEKIIGVNCYQLDAEEGLGKPTERPDFARMLSHVERFKAFKANRSQDSVRRALELLGAGREQPERKYFRARC